MLFNELSWIKPGEKLTGTPNPDLPIGTLNRPLEELLKNDEYLLDYVKILEGKIKTHDHDDIYYTKNSLQQVGVKRDYININKIFPKEAKSFYLLKSPFNITITNTPQSLESYVGLGAEGYVFSVHMSLSYVPVEGYYSNITFLSPDVVADGRYSLAITPGASDVPRGDFRQIGTDGFGFCFGKASHNIWSNGLIPIIEIIGAIR